MRTMYNYNNYYYALYRCQYAFSKVLTLMTKINRVINPHLEGRLQGTTEWCPLLAFKFWGIGL